VSRPSGEQFEIVFGERRAVAVEIGGGLRAFSVSGREILDGYGPEEPATSGRGQVLIPWPNRIEDGTYEFDGRTYRLPLNEPEQGNAIHGLVRDAPWRATEREEDRVVLEHVLEAQAGYPFTLGLRIEYALSNDGLEVTTTATNLGAERCPYGSGAHPYLRAGTPTVDTATLSVPAETVLVSDDRGIPVEPLAVDGTELDFREPSSLSAKVLDHCFTDIHRGDDGRARIRLVDQEGCGATVWVDESYGYVMLFTGDPLPDVDRRSLAVEPMTCPPNAFRSGESVIVLEPGGAHTSAWGLAEYP
jgi:aldose 1-epimerase